MWWIPGGHDHPYLDGDRPVHGGLTPRTGRSVDPKEPPRASHIRHERDKEVIR